MTVLANSVLTQVTVPGGLDRTGEPGAPVTVWAGRAPAYLKRVDRAVVSGGVEMQVKRDTLTILDRAGAAIAQAGADWDASVVTVEDRRAATPVTRTFTVKAAEHRQAGTIADSVRLELDRERP